MLSSSQYVYLILTATLLYSCLWRPFSFFCSAVFLLSFRHMFWCSRVFRFVCFSWEWPLFKSTLFLGWIGLIRRSSGGWSLTICSECIIPKQFCTRHSVSLVWPSLVLPQDSFLGWEIGSQIFFYFFSEIMYSSSVDDNFLNTLSLLSYLFTMNASDKKNKTCD